MHIKTKYHGILVSSLLNGVLTPKLLNNLFASWFLINFDFLLLHVAQLGNIVVLALLVFKTLGFLFSVFFPHFKQYDFILFFKLLQLVSSGR